MYNWQWWGLRRYIIIYWRNKGILVRKGYWNRKTHVIKLLNRNCISGKKYKALVYLIKALQLIHLFTYYYGKKSRVYDVWKIRRYLFFSFDNFFFFNRPFYTKKIKIRKKMPNQAREFQVWEEKMPFELFKWFWLLSFAQPFKKTYQRYAFILLEFIFFTRKNMFKSLIRKLHKKEDNEFEKVRKSVFKVMPKKRTRARFLGKIHLK